MASKRNRRPADLEIRNARIIFRNFTGEVRSKFDKEGRRTFSVVIDDPMVADELQNDGWYIRQTVPRDGYDDPTYHIKVIASWAKKPPVIYTETVRGIRTRITEDNVAHLDHANIKDVDIVIQPSYYEYAGREGYTAYVSEMIVRLDGGRLIDDRDLTSSSKQDGIIKGLLRYIMQVDHDENIIVPGYDTKAALIKHLINYLVYTKGMSPTDVYVNVFGYTNLVDGAEEVKILGDLDSELAEFLGEDV